MREGREGKERDITASTGDHGDDVKQNVDERSGEVTKEE